MKYWFKLNVDKDDVVFKLKRKGKKPKMRRNKKSLIEQLYGGQ